MFGSGILDGHAAYALRDLKDDYKIHQKCIFMSHMLDFHFSFSKLSFVRLVIEISNGVRYRFNRFDL